MRYSLLLALAACSTTAADRPRKVSPAELDTMQQIHMHANFDLVRAIERLLIRGKLDDARSFAHAIATAPESPAHGPWAAHTVAVRDRAAAVERAQSQEVALREVAKLGGECGNCHADVGASPRFASYPTPPPDGPGIERRMARHRWAADRIWEGIIGNQDAAWQAGLEVLAEPPPDLAGKQAHLGRKLQRLADQARRPSAGTLTTRSTTYGEILNLCASCHAQPRN